MTQRIFISSVQKEFADQRRAMRNFLLTRDPLIAKPMFLPEHVKKAGSGILDMIALCRQAGLPAPLFRHERGRFIQTLGWPRATVPTQVTTEVAPEVTPEVTPEVLVARSPAGEMTREELQQSLGLKDNGHFRKAYLNPALESGLIEMTIPAKPRSRLQKYRLTTKGKLQGGRNA